MRNTLLLPLILISTSLPIEAAIKNVWALGDGEKVFRFETEHPYEKSNAVWDGERIRLTGLYNEVLGLQVIVEADQEGARQVSVGILPALHQDNGAAIGSIGGVPYGEGGGFEIFTQHYLHVRRPTEPHWFYGSEASAPKQMTGWIPDALIPPNARPEMGGMPVDIPETQRQVMRRQERVEITERQPGTNQGFWIDVYLPRNRETHPAGIYEGKVQVMQDGKLVRELPLEIELIDHYLPDENHSTVWVFGSDKVVQMYLPELSLSEIERRMKYISHRHRIDYVGGNEAHGRPFDPAVMEAYKPYLSGEAFTPEQGYQGPGTGVGEKLFPIGMYGSITEARMTDRATAMEESDRWVEWFEANAPEVAYFWYIMDEPGPLQFDYLRELASHVKENPGPGKKLPVFTTRRYTPELKDAIDYWAGGHGVDLDALADLEARGGKHWFYNGSRPRYGSVILEAEAVDLAVNGWVKYLHGIDTWFVWESTHWRHNLQGPKAHTHQRVYSNPLTFINWSMKWGNGDGILFYPGRVPFYPNEDPGVNDVLTSIRLKTVRRGQQDFELLWLAEQKAGRETVEAIARRLVPRSLEAGMDEPVSWSENGDDYVQARLELIKLLDAAR